MDLRSLSGDRGGKSMGLARTQVQAAAVREVESYPWARIVSVHSPLTERPPVSPRPRRAVTNLQHLDLAEGPTLGPPWGPVNLQMLRCDKHLLLPYESVDRTSPQNHNEGDGPQ
jgi:hypothetical protein